MWSCGRFAIFATALSQALFDVASEGGVGGDEVGIVESHATEPRQRWKLWEVPAPVVRGEREKSKLRFLARLERYWCDRQEAAVVHEGVTFPA
jgi:hypothetical protein